MTWIELGNPRPRPEPSRHRLLSWPASCRTLSLRYQQSTRSTPDRPFADIALNRRSGREFRALDIDRLGWLLARAN